MWIYFTIIWSSYYNFIPECKFILANSVLGIYFLFWKSKKKKKKLKKNTKQNMNQIYDLIYEQPNMEESIFDEEKFNDPIKLQKNLKESIKRIAKHSSIEIGIAAEDGLSLVKSSSKLEDSFLGITTGLYDYIKSRVFDGLKKVSVMYEEEGKEKTIHILPIIVHGAKDYLIIVSDNPVLKNEKVIIENILGHLKKYKFIDNPGDE